MRPGFAAALLLAALAAGAHAAPPAEHEAGRRIWNFRCYYCHGYSGDARTLAARFLQPPPRDFTALSPEQLPREAMLAAVRDGRPGTAMQAFRSVLSEPEIAAVVDFARAEFVRHKRENTRYHTAENGWPRHERYRAAFPFATGEIATDVRWEDLDASQAEGRRHYMSACVSCHDRGRVREPGAVWELRAVSFPPNEDACAGCHVYSKALHQGVRPPGYPAADRGANPYTVHDVPPALRNPSRQAKRGEQIFQRNCAFCHAADGSGKNWIGAFLEPHPRDLSEGAFMAERTRAELTAAIREGLPGTSMPAWKSVLSREEIAALVAYLEAAFGPLGPPRRTGASATRPR